MTATHSHLLKRIETLRATLSACHRQLGRRDSDPEALHDLRVSLRRLRSLLRPVRDRPELQALESLLAGLLARTNAIRDTEVLLAELSRKQPALADTYRQSLQTAYAELAASSEPGLILQHLATLPVYWHTDARPVSAPRLRRLVVKTWGRQRRQLRALLKKKRRNVDLHQVRLRVKKIRYLIESYEKMIPCRRSLARRLQQLQQLVGDWHDRQVWLERARHDDRLATLTDGWTDEADALAKQAGKRLRSLRRALKT